MASTITRLFFATTGSSLGFLLRFCNIVQKYSLGSGELTARSQRLAQTVVLYIFCRILQLTTTAAVNLPVFRYLAPTPPYDMFMRSETNGQTSMQANNCGCQPRRLLRCLLLSVGQSLETMKVSYGDELHKVYCLLFWQSHETCSRRQHWYCLLHLLII